MLDPIVQAALVGIALVVLRALFAALGVEVDEELLTTLAGAIVVWLIGLFGLRAVRAGAKKAMGEKDFEKSSLWANEE